MNIEKKWFSVLEVQERLGIPNQTLRRYINTHGHHLNVKKQAKAYFLAEESIKVIQTIRKLYEEGMTAQVVNDALVERAVPLNITVTEGEKQVTVHISEALQNMQNTIDERINEQNEVIRSLTEQLKKQQEYIETKLEERDRNLMAAMKESLEARKQIAVTQEEAKKGLFARLFGK